MPERMGRNELVGVIAVIAVAAAARLVLLGRAPPPMYQDEVGRAYDAWCIWETGADHHGVKWPVLLRRFGPGDYDGTFAAYVLAPFVGLLGPSVVSARFPLALLGTLNVVLLWWWARRELDPIAAIAAAAVLALSPAHVHQSRLSVDVVLVPTVLTAGLATLSAAGFRFRRPTGGPLRWPLMLLSGVIFGVGLYSYVAARVAVPAMLIALVLAFPRRLMRLVRDARTRPAIITFLLGLTLGCIPFVSTLRHHPEQVFGRARYASVLNTEAVQGSRILTVLKNYALHWDPRFLFLTGDASRVNAVPGLGMLPWYGIVLLPIGMVLALRRFRSDGVAAWCLAWMLIAPLPAALSMGGLPHSWRCNGVLPPLALACGLAVSWGWSFLQRAAGRDDRGGLYAGGTAFVAAITLVAGTAAWHAHRYFVTLPRTHDMGPGDVEVGFQAGFDEAFRYTRAAARSYDHCVITVYVNQGYIYLLYFGRISPQECRRANVIREPWAMGFDAVVQFNEYFFLPSLEGDPPFDDLAAGLAAGWPNGQRVLLVTRPRETGRGRLLRIIRGRSGRPLLELREARTEHLR